MTWLAWSLVIFLTAMTGFLGGRYGLEWLLDRLERPKRIPLDRLADPAPLPGELPIAGYFELPREFQGPFDLPGVLFELSGPYGPFPVDTGPLLILSEKDAADAEIIPYTRRLIAETDWLIGEAEAKIPPRWR